MLARTFGLWLGALLVALICMGPAQATRLTQQRSLLQGGRKSFLSGIEQAALDGMWDGDFIDPSANTVGHACLSPACRKQFEKGMFSMNITGGGTTVDWIDFEVGGLPKNPAACEKDGLSNVSRPSSLEVVSGTISSYSNDMLMVSVSPKDFMHNTISREGLIIPDPFTWCIKFKVYLLRGKVMAELRLFEDDFVGTLTDWIDIKRTAGNFVCHTEDLNAKDCIYDFGDDGMVTVKRSEVVQLECLDGNCLSIANSR